MNAARFLFPCFMPAPVEFAQAVGTYDLDDLSQVVILGWLVDVADGLSYPFGSCSEGFFGCDQFGWSLYHDHAGLLRHLEYSLTGAVRVCQP